MKWLLQTFELPLFARELTELAARKRTYVIRVIYAVALLWLGLTALSDELRELARNASNAGDFAVLGAGGKLFYTIVERQMLGIHLFMPAIACAAITTEKERNTLGLLLLTKLGPWRILFEKLFSRLLPMVTCLLLSVPMLALAYSFGGVGVLELVNATWLLLATCVQVACLTLLCSSFFKSTVAAFIWSYLAQIGIAIGLLFVDRLTFSPNQMWGTSYSVSASGYMVFRAAFAQSEAGLSESVFTILWQARRVFTSTILFFLGARYFLIRRASVTSKSYILMFFRKLDKIFVEMNEVTGGIELVKDKGSLPEDAPIAWREVTKKSLGKARYLFRVFLALEIPTVSICMMAVGSGAFGDPTRLAGLCCFLWAVGALIVTIKASTLIASERSSETLDVLLTTPLTAQEILRQKCAGLTRVAGVASVPILTCIAFSAYMKTGGAYGWTYLVWGIMQLVVYVPLISWVAIWIGLRVGSPTKSIFVAMAVLIVWVSLPAVIEGIAGWAEVDIRFGEDEYYYVVDDSPQYESVLAGLTLLSGPSAGIWVNEYMTEAFTPNPGWIALHLVFFGGLMLFVRSRVLKTASRRLGRAEPGEKSEAAINEPVTQTAESREIEASHAIS